MNAKTLAGLFLVVLLAGCATGRKEQDLQLQELQSRIGNLETELERKNQQISTLENALQEEQSKSVSVDKPEDIKVTQMSAKQIQRALKNAGFYRGSVDGKIGPKTKKAIKDFQKAHGLKVDGVMGEKTTAELSKFLQE